MNSLLKRFEDDGYLVMPEFHNTAMCDSLITRAQELSDLFVPQESLSLVETNASEYSADDYFLASGDKIRFFFEPDAFDASGSLKGDVFHSLNKIGHAMHDLDPLFGSFSRSPALQKLSRHLDLGQLVLIQSLLIFKHPHIGGVVDVHQDATFLYTEPASCIGFWFALEDATIENGCLWVLPGGHRTPLRSWFRRKPEGGTEFFVLDNSPHPIQDMEPLEVRKGTCIVLHGMLPHFSLPNTSSKARPAYAIHGIDRRAHYPESNWLRRDMLTLRGFK